MMTEYFALPQQQKSPVSIFKVKNLESMSFPVQFPDGKNTFDEPDRATSIWQIRMVVEWPFM